MGSLPKTKKKNIPKSIHEMSKETLQETLKKKKECNAKALETVEKLCEICVDEEWFLANLQFINQCHFDDATIERAITKICGYPLCDKKLEKVPTQQYHISTRYNKVFDITERKNFCSSCCYKSAMHVKKQLFTSPLWFRDQEVIPKYTILKSNKSSMGEEVVFFPDKIKIDKEELVKKTIPSEKPVNVIKEIEKKCSELTINDTDVTEKKVTEDERTCNLESSDIATNATVSKEDSDIISSAELSKSSNKVKLVERNKTKPTVQQVDTVKKIEKCISDWFSLETFFHLYGEQKLKELLEGNATTIKQILNSKLSLAGHNKKIDKMIQLYELLDSELFSGKEIKTNLKPLPDYSILKEEGKTLEIKVKAFYQGQLQVKESEKEEKTEEKVNCEDSKPIYLPLIDAHAQTALRRKIILDKLGRVLPELMKLINSEYVMQMNEVRDLVSTFMLSPHNITFKPTEWYLIGIILIKLLSQKNTKLQSALSSDESQSQISVVLSNFELQKEYLDNLIFRLTDSGNLMEKLSEINR